MTWRKTTTGLLIFVLLGVGWAGYSIYVTWQGIPDAYAAWDTGTLLVEYLKTHDDRWPRSWEELLSATESLKEHNNFLKGSDDKGYYIYGDLRTRVTVDWSADVKAIATFDWNKGNLSVVTRSDGKKFPVVWEGAEPNMMVWRYLNGQGDD